MTDTEGNGSLRLRLFVTDESPGSCAARHNLAAALESLGLPAEMVEEIDVMVLPELAIKAGILVTPTLEIMRGAERWLIAGRLTVTDALVARLS